MRACSCRAHQRLQLTSTPNLNPRTQLWHFLHANVEACPESGGGVGGHRVGGAVCLCKEIQIQKQRKLKHIINELALSEYQQQQQQQHKQHHQQQQAIIMSIGFLSLRFWVFSLAPIIGSKDIDLPRRIYGTVGKWPVESCVHMARKSVQFSHRRQFVWHMRCTNFLLGNLSWERK